MQVRDNDDGSLTLKLDKSERGALDRELDVTDTIRGGIMERIQRTLTDSRKAKK